MKNRFLEKKNKKCKLTLFFLFLIVAVSFYNSKRIENFFYKLITPSHAQIKETIKNLIIDDLDFFIETFKEAQTKQINRLKSDMTKKMDQYQNELFSSQNSPVVGNPKGSVTMAYFFDYNCGYCHKANKILNNILASDNDIKLIYKELPILGSESMELAKAALAVHFVAPDKYSAFHDSLMTPEETDYKVILNTLGISQAEVLEKMNSADVQDQIDEVARLAATIGLSGTPTVIIGNDLISALDENTLKLHVEKIRKNIQNEQNH